MPINASNTIIYPSSTQSISNATYTTMTAPSSVVNGSVDFLTGAGSNEVIIPSGVDEVMFAVRYNYATNNGAGYDGFRIRNTRLSTTIQEWYTLIIQNGTAYEITTGFFGPYSVVATDTFALQVYQSQGGSRTLNTRSFFWILDVTGDKA